MCPLGALFCLCGVLGHLAPVHRCARPVCCVACAVSWATWLLFTGVPARCVALRVRCPGSLGSCSPVCLSVCCVVSALSWATWLLFTAVPARCVVLLVPCPGPVGSCPTVCPLGVLCCLCGVLGHLAPVYRCPRSVRCLGCAVFRATSLLFTVVPTRCVVLGLRCPGPLGSCSPVRPLGALLCCCGVLGDLAPVHKCACRCVVLRLRCPGPLCSCSLLCLLAALFCLCRVLGHLAPVLRCARSVCCVACAVSWATWLLFTGVPARCNALGVRCSGPLGSCSPVCPLGVLCCVCGVLGHFAPVHPCARVVCCVPSAVFCATWLLFTGVPPRCVALRVRCPGPLGSCSPVCPRGLLCCVCGVLGHLAPVHRCACSVRCFAAELSWATWLLFTVVPARCVVLCVRCPGSLGSCSPVCIVLRVWCPGPLGPCSPVCPLGVSGCVCGVLGHLAPVHRCASSVRCCAGAVSWATGLLITGVPARCLVLLVRCPGPLGSCSPLCPPGALCCVCGVLGHLAPAHRCARSVRCCCVSRAVSWASWLLCTSVLARCAVSGVRFLGPLGCCSPVCSLGVLCWGLRVRGVAAGRTLVHPDGGYS